MKLVFATNNKNKLRELQAWRGDRFECLSLDEIGCFEKIPKNNQPLKGIPDKKPFISMINMEYPALQMIQVLR